MIKQLGAVICLAIVLQIPSTRPVGAEEVKTIPVTGNIQWVYSYAEGQKLARETGKPLWVVFRCER